MGIVMPDGLFQNGLLLVPKVNIKFSYTMGSHEVSRLNWKSGITRNRQ